MSMNAISNIGMGVLTAAQIERFAAMVVAGVPDYQLADVFGISQQDVAITKQSREYLEVFSKLSNERYEQDSELDGGWDLIEENAIVQIANALKRTCDPNFALRAAMVANKAVRRTRGNNGTNLNPDPLNAGRAGTVVINMSAVFMQRMEQIRATRPEEQVPSRVIENISQGRVHELLTGPREVDDPAIVEAALAKITK
jgi:hypothetical protein